MAPCERATWRPCSLSSSLRPCAQEVVLPLQGSNGIDVHLAVHPHCGPLWGMVSDVNAGLALAEIQTIVSFCVRTRSVHFTLHVFIGVLHLCRTRIRTGEGRMVARSHQPS